MNEQLQQQVAEMQSDSNRLLEDVHQLSLTLSQTQERLLSLEAQREESFMASPCMQLLVNGNSLTSVQVYI